jgi:acrylyl-CoA reductase (NADPH)
MLAGAAMKWSRCPASRRGFVPARDRRGTKILRRQELDLGSKPMEAVQWAGAIDNVGGELLTWLTRTVDYNGNIASIGLAGSHELHTTVMPFILRGVNLLGINSSATPRAVRLDVWRRIATDLRPSALDTCSASRPRASTSCARWSPRPKSR